VIIEQTDPDADHIKLQGLRNIIQGFQFHGGKTAIHIDTHNAGAMPKILDCEFWGTKGPAIILDGNSTLLTVDGCWFHACDQVLINHADIAILKNSFIDTSKDMKDKAAIVNYNTLHIHDILGTPHINREYDQRWIDNYGNLRVSRFRFGGEWGGMTAVVNFAKPFKWPTTVTLDQCYVYARGNNQRKTAAAVYLKEIPNIIRITDCSGFMGAKLIDASPDIDFDKVFKKTRPAYFQFTFWGNSYPGGFDPGAVIPEQLLPYTNRSIADVHGESFEKKEEK
jgi:hypothetical protein